MHYHIVDSVPCRVAIVLAAMAVASACGSGTRMSASLETDSAAVPSSAAAPSQSCDGPIGVSSQSTQPQEPFVVGDNNCYMIQAHFPKAPLRAMLPDRLTIPNDTTLQAHYPDVLPRRDAHPFLLSFCHGSGIHDVLTKLDVPEQEEIMVVFPVVYTHDDGQAYVCSYVPVLYLDSFLGVLGGLVFGLRKEYHPEMQHGRDGADSAWWRIDGIIDASFEAQADPAAADLPCFIQRIFANPFVAVSYPLPFAQTVFYEAKVYPDTVRAASETFSWSYQGTTVEHGDDTWSVYADYSFTMSLPLGAKAFFQ